MADENEKPAMATHFPRLLSLPPPIQAGTEKFSWNFCCEIATIIHPDAFTHAAETKTGVAVLSDGIHWVIVLHQRDEAFKLNKSAGAVRKLHTAQAILGKF
jgi:hypothetical protein